MFLLLRWWWWWWLLLYSAILRSQADSLLFPFFSMYLFPSCYNVFISTFCLCTFIVFTCTCLHVLPVCSLILHYGLIFVFFWQSCSLTVGFCIQCTCCCVLSTHSLYLRVHFHALPKSSLFLWSPSSLLVSILFYFCKLFISVVVFCKMFISVLCLSPIFFQATRNQVHVPSRVKQTICSFINCIFLPMDAFCLDRTSNINLELTSFHSPYQTIWTH